MVLTGNFPEIRLKYVALEWKRELYFTVENFPGDQLSIKLINRRKQREYVLELAHQEMSCRLRDVHLLLNNLLKKK
jgi:hypothetical protein